MLTHTAIVGCGYVGSALGVELAARGHRVWGLSRDPSMLPEGIERVRADVTRPETLRLPRELDCIVYCVAGARDDAGYHRLYVEGLRNILHASSELALRCLAFVSSTAVYGQADGSWITEASPTEPAGFNGRRTLEAEGMILASSKPSLVLRCGGIYGPGRTRLLDSVRAGQASFDPSEASYTNRIHRDDVAGSLRACLEADDDARRRGVWLATDAEPAPRREVLEFLAARLGAPPPPSAPTLPGTRRAGSKRCDSSKLRSVYRLRFPTYREGYTDVLARTPR